MYHVALREHSILKFIFPSASVILDLLFAQWLLPHDHFLKVVPRDPVLVPFWDSSHNRLGSDVSQPPPSICLLELHPTTTQSPMALSNTACWECAQPLFLMTVNCSTLLPCNSSSPAPARCPYYPALPLLLSLPFLLHFSYHSLTQLVKSTRKHGPLSSCIYPRTRPHKHPHFLLTLLVHLC